MNTRRARLRALAKINLSLEVLNRRPDGYHDLRTIFQTISLADSLELAWAPGRGARVELTSALDIPNNLVVRAAKVVLEESGARGTLEIRLDKRIPMGGGLGGGSTDAAAVLLGLPVLTGKAVPFERLHALATALGSDVPFFLYGGTALGLGRGTELYPLPDAHSGPLALLCPDVHVSTPEAYRMLDLRPAANGQELSCAEGARSPKINISQSLAFALGAELSAGEWSGFCQNDFETAVFPGHPRLRALKARLTKVGARPAMMTGSGAALYGAFRDRRHLESALAHFKSERVLTISLVGRRQYQRLWWRQLAEHLNGRTWPLRSRYAR
jgi:4-diphosphocytidyl-2-C-methyl-D-erythritol kinase